MSNINYEVHAFFATFAMSNKNYIIMKLSNERLDEITSKILERAGKFSCPICGSTEGFTFPEHEFELMSCEKNGENLLLKEGTSDYFRMFPLTCSNCGFVANFNLQKIDRFLSEQKK